MNRSPQSVVASNNAINIMNNNNGISKKKLEPIP